LPPNACEPRAVTEALRERGLFRYQGYAFAVGFLDWLNPWTWRADRRGNRELALTEERDRYLQTAILGARYEGERPEPFEPFYMAIGDAVLSGDMRVDHVLFVNCAGPAPARDVYVWLAENAEGERIPRTDEKHLGLLGIGDERKVEFEETEFPGGCVPCSGALMCRWTDGNGTHVDSLLDITVHL
jgi:hypothetical protein